MGGDAQLESLVQLTPKHRGQQAANYAAYLFSGLMR